MKKPLVPSSQSGVTLVELVVSIVVIAVGVTGVLMAIQFTTGHSADPMLQQQAVAIADSYMDEILLHSYDEVQDYDGTSEDPSSELSDYTVQIDVTEIGDFGPDDSMTARKIQVSVQHDSYDAGFALTGYKTKP